jgi:hypothetical protein
MSHQNAQYRSARLAAFCALIAGVLSGGGLLSACSSTGDSPLTNNPLTANNPFTVFIDPGEYSFYNCEQLANQRIGWKAKEQELKLLMDKASQSTGGGVVNVIAYQGDYVAATERLKVIEMTARNKNCPQK